MRPAKANVVVAIPTNGSDGREHMSGVFDYVKEHPHWMVQTIHMRTAITNGMLDDALKGADGLILDIAYDIERLAKTIIDKHPNLKIVVTNDYLVPLFARHPHCRSLLIDSVAVGKDAAHYFNSLGRFASYGFVHGAIRFPWSSEREEGFRSAMPRNTPLLVFPEGNHGKAQTGPDAPAMGTVVLPCPRADIASNPNLPKVVLSSDDYAIYFSRSMIPYLREGGEETTVYRHWGIYAYRRETLAKFVSLPEGRLEKCEKLEQLRALENGIRIKVIRTTFDSIGIDTPEDLVRAQEFLARRQKTI